MAKKPDPRTAQTRRLEERIAREVAEAARLGNINGMRVALDEVVCALYDEACDAFMENHMEEALRLRTLWRRFVTRTAQVAQQHCEALCTKSSGA